jgi:hypothetical protein
MLAGLSIEFVEIPSRAHSGGSKAIPPRLENAIDWKKIKGHVL